MPKAIEDFIDGDSCGGLPGPALRPRSCYRYRMYAAGYAAGLGDAGGEKLREAVQNITGRIEELVKNRKEKDAL